MSGELSGFIDEWGFFVAMPELVIKAWPTIGTDAVALFLYLRYRTNRERGVAFPSFDDMQAGMGWRRERIAAAVRALTSAGFLERKKAVGKVTTYRLVRPPDVAVVCSPDAGLRGANGSPDAEPSQSAPRPNVVRQGDAIQNLRTQDSFTQEGMARSSKAQDRWIQAQVQLKVEASKPNFDRFIGPTWMQSLKGGEAVIVCEGPDPEYQVIWLRDRLGKACARLLMCDEVHFVVAADVAA